MGEASSATSRSGQHTASRSWRARLAPERVRCCPSCGADAASTWCEQCGTGVSMGPAPTLTDLGRVRSHHRMLRKQPLLVLRRSGPTIGGVTLDGKPVDTTDDKVADEADAPAPRTVSNWSAAGLLASWIADQRRGGSAITVPEAILVAACHDAVAGDLGQLRRFAQDLVELGLLDLVEGLAVSPGERAWVALVGAARRGEPLAAAAALRALPPTRYRPKVWALAKVWPNLDPNARAQLIPHLEPFADTEPMARALLERLRPSLGAAALADTARALASVSTGDAVAATVDADLRRLTGFAHPVVGTRLGPASRVLEALDPRSTPVELLPGDLAGVAVSLLDDLAQRGRLGVDAERLVDDPELAVYLRARVDPSSVPDHALDTLAFDAERARRAIASGDTKLIEQLPPGPMASHAAELAKITRQRHDAVVLEQVLPEHRDTVRDLVELCRAVERGLDPVPCLTDRIAGDPSVWPVLHNLLPPGSLRPGAFAATHRAMAEWTALSDARALLFSSRWQDAIESARTCLSLAHDESIRDEALNLIACGHHQLGQDEAAIAALGKALDGAYSESLLANAGVVARLLDPELAAKYLGKLAAEAPTLALRLAAVRQIVEVWQTSVTVDWAGSEGDAHLPVVVREPVRAVVTEPVPIDDFRRLVRLLSRFDARWLASADLRPSPHAASLEARYWVAAAEGADERVAVIASVGANDPVPEWFEAEIVEYCEGLSDFVVQQLMADSDDSDGPAVLALTVADRVRRIGDELRVRLIFGGSALLLDHFNPKGTIAAEVMVDRLARGRQLAAGLGAAAGPPITILSHLAHKKMAFNHVLDSFEDLPGLINEANAALDRFRRAQDPVTLRRQEATAAAVAQAASRHQQRILALLPFLDPDDLDAHRLLRSRLDELRATEVQARGLM